MNAKRIDIFLVLLYVGLFTLYYEIVTIPHYSHYLVNTPPQFLFIPLLLLIMYRIWRHEPAELLVTVFAFFFVWTFTLAGSLDQFNNRTILYAEQKEKIRICSWNSAYFFDWNRELAFETLKKQNCQIIMLQEVWKSQAHLPTLLQMRQKYLPDYDIRIFEEFVFFIPTGSDTNIVRSEYKGFYAVDLHFQEQYLRIYNIHLWNPLVPRPQLVSSGAIEYQDAQRVRELQEAELVSSLDAATKESATVFIAGDFNSMQNDAIIRKISRVGKKLQKLSIIGSSPLRNRNTYPAGNPFIQIDFAYISQIARPQAKKKMICLPKSSDHCLLVLDVVL